MCKLLAYIILEVFIFSDVLHNASAFAFAKIAVYRLSTIPIKITKVVFLELEKTQMVTQERLNT